MDIPKYTAIPEKTIITSVPQNFPRVLLAICLRYLTDKKNGLMWRPKPHNCEIRVFESKN